MQIENWFLIVCTIALGYPSFVLTPSQYYRKYKSRSRVAEFFNTRGFKFLYFAFFSVCVLLITDSKDRNAENDLRLAAISSKNDIINAQDLRQSKTDRILGKYGFMLDTTKNLLVAIRNKPIAEKPEPINPELDFALLRDSISNGTFYYHLKMTSAEASCTIIRLNAEIFFKIGGKYFLTPTNPSVQQLPIPKNQSRLFKVNMIVNQDISDIAWHLKGEYSSAEGRRFSFDTYQIYNFRENETGIAIMSERESIQRAVRK